MTSGNIAGKTKPCVEELEIVFMYIRAGRLLHRSTRFLYANKPESDVLAGCSAAGGGSQRRASR